MYAIEMFKYEDAHRLCRICEEDATEEVMDTEEALDEDGLLVSMGDEDLADVDNLLESDEKLF